ncbi:MAG: glutathione S-transferase [Phenylobacterium sp.]
MKLFLSPASPYARKVWLAAAELGVADRIEVSNATVSPVADNPDFAALNPLGKIPVLITDEGLALYDSRVIADHLDSLTSRRLCPSTGSERWIVQTLHAAADGLLDAALLARYEEALRPEPLRWADWRRGQGEKIVRVLDVLERSDLRSGEDVRICDIAAACALGYLDFRFAAEPWRDGRPRLTAFFEAFTRRPAWAQSDPTRAP